MYKVENILKANGVLTTVEGSFSNAIIIAWCELGINEEARFKIDADLKKVYEFLGF